MGACYSKQPLLGNSKSKTPKIKYHPPKDNGIVLETMECVPEENRCEEKARLENNESDSVPGKGDSSEDVLIVSSSLFLAAESAEQSRVGDRGVAPSDSGIESIGTNPDETQEVCLPSYGKSNLSKQLERLSRGSCHKCGNFKLDDSAITALFTNSYCVCGPRQAGRSNVNPKCQTHGARNVKKGHSVSSNDAKDNIDDYMDSTCSTSQAHMSISNRSNEKSNIISDSEVLAPLAHFDSVDFNLNDSPTQKSLKRRSLLSEILDLTDSICKCDFYSNEYCCVVDTHAKIKCNGSGLNRINEPMPERFLTDVSFESQASDCTITKSDNEEHTTIIHLSDSYSTKSNLSSPKKMASLTKNVSFAHEDASEEDIEKACTQASYISPNKTNRYSRDNVTTSEASSGIYTHSGSVSESLLTAVKDSPKHSMSLGRQAAVMLSSSSSDVLDDCTEDDLGSLDLDSLSRVTSLSYGSIRQLMESTEDLVQPLEDVKRVVIDGEDCVAIPTETYFQLKSDLASLKQQLLFLSSLIQEDVDQQTMSASFDM